MNQRNTNPLVIQLKPNLKSTSFKTLKGSRCAVTDKYLRRKRRITRQQPPNTSYLYTIYIISFCVGSAKKSWKMCDCIFWNIATYLTWYSNEQPFQKHISRMILTLLNIFTFIQHKNVSYLLRIGSFSFNLIDKDVITLLFYLIIIKMYSKFR